MSMENAILEHAGALKELAAAIRESVKVMAHAQLGTALSNAVDALANVEAHGGKTTDTLLQDKAAELAAATEQRAAAAREAQKKDQAAAKAYGDMTEEEKIAYEENDKRMAKEIAEKRAAEVVKEVSDEIEAKGTVTSITTLPDDTAANLAEVEKQNAPADLDYAKDVRPVLLAAIKKAGKDAVAAMIGKYGVDKADKLKPEQLPAVLAEAQKLAA